VVDDFTPEDRYFYLYLLTNPHTNLCGCYEISFKQMSDELGYTKETVEKLIRRFSDEHNVLSYNEPTKEILLYNWSKYNWTKSPKFIKALSAEITRVKYDSYRQFLESRREGDTVSIPYPYPMDTTVTVTDNIYNKSNTDNSTVSNTINSDNKQSKTEFDSKGDDADKKGDNADEIDFAWWQETYNRICTDLPKVKLMTEGRKRSVRIFLKQFTAGQFEEICRMASASDFLSGKIPGNTWKANFDFLVRLSAAVKVLEGTYDNKGGAKSSLPKW